MSELMPLYFLHVREGNSLRLDPEGSVHATLEDARQEAVESARELISADVLAGNSLHLDRVIEIADDAGAVLLKIPFRSVVDLE